MTKKRRWPEAVGKTLGPDDSRIQARLVMAQGRQNTNWGINFLLTWEYFCFTISFSTCDIRLRRPISFGVLVC